MSMLSRSLAAGVLALAGLALATPARAEDTLRLALPASDEAATLDLNDMDEDFDADTIAVARGRGGRGGGRGVARGGFRGRGFAGRGFRGGFHRARFARFPRVARFGRFGRFPVRVGFGRRFFAPRFRSRVFISPRWSFWGFYPRVYSPSVYWFYYPTASSWATYPISETVASTPLYMDPVPSGQAPVMPSTPAPPKAGTNTFPYDGGPRAPVPMPTPDEAAVQPPLKRVPMLLEDFLVSMSPNGAKWNYPAYGEKPTRGSPAVPSAVISTNDR
jgi:hypothetical protein